MDFKKLEENLKGWNEWGVPSSSIVVCRNHEILYKKSFGISNAEHNKPAESSDRYFMYSCTKPMTATAVMQNIECGKIGLDDPVYKYLPEFKNIYMLSDGKKIPCKNVMTIRHLLSMTSGIDYTMHSKYTEELVSDPNKKPTLQDIVQTFIMKPIAFEPGTQYMYGLSHDILAAIVEIVNGISFAEYQKQNIFDPLGMSNTYFCTSKDEDHEVADLYRFDSKDNKIYKMAAKNSFVITDGYISGGAGLVSTPDDYIKFADALACLKSKDGVQILKPETIDLMRTEQHHNFMVENFSCPSGNEYGYALGVRTLVNRDNGAKGGLGEFGWDGAAGSYVLIDPQNKLSVFYAEHLNGWGSPNSQGRFHIKMRDIIYDCLGF